MKKTYTFTLDVEAVDGVKDLHNNLSGLINDFLKDYANTRTENIDKIKIEREINAINEAITEQQKRRGILNVQLSTIRHDEEVLRQERERKALLDHWSCLMGHDNTGDNDKCLHPKCGITRQQTEEHNKKVK